MTSPGPERAQAWSRYWASGAAHSCAGSFDGAYGGAIGTFWRDVFAGLSVDARVLDIACGNGPLARMLLQQRPDPGLRCDAVDLAEVKPAWALTEPRVRFHPGCGAEDLPFADGEFELAVSQYGIEYSDLARSLPEALRVVRRGGMICLALHAVESWPVRLAHEELGHIDWVSGREGWLAAARAMVEPMALSGTAPGQRQLAAHAAHYARIRERFDACTAALHARRERSDCPDVLTDLHNQAVQAFRAAHRQGQAAGDATLKSMAGGLQDIRTRLQDMTQHALDAPRRAALSNVLTAAGAAVDWRDLSEDGRLMAVGMVARLPD